MPGAGAVHHIKGGGWRRLRKVSNDRIAPKPARCDPAGRWRGRRTRL